MCLAAWILEDHPIYSMLLIHNRDEYFSRDTEPMHWWKDHKGILAGRDGKEGGTWLGLSDTGKLAFVTNIREPLEKQPATSRGFLPVGFLVSSESPIDYLSKIEAEAENYQGFNLVVADFVSQKMGYMSHSLCHGDLAAQEVSTGVHGLSNSRLDTPWPKVQRAKERLIGAVRKFGNEEIPEEYILEEILKDNEKAEKSVLPETGMSRDWEHKLSSIFVSEDTDMGHYGTMSMTIIAVRKNGRLTSYEKYISDGVWHDHKFEFEILEENGI